MGGRPWVSDDQGEYFTRVLFRYFSKKLNLAFCIFAQAETDWQETEQRNIEMFNLYKGKRDISFQTMTPENFAEVSKWADVIYMPGGDPDILKQKLAACGDIARLWDGKVIAGSSAGADVLCKYYLFLQNKTLSEGLGWVNASCIPHWRDKFEDYTDKHWDEEETKLHKMYPEIPILCIPEGEFVEITVK